ncbi:peptidylprolyl isomerase [Campylobacter sp.]
MIKNLIFIALFLAICADARYVGGLVATVDNEPITTYELNNIMKKMNINKEEALNLLIRDKLELAQIKKLNITVSEFEIDQKIAQLASSNNMSVNSFKELLKSRGTSEAKLREDMQISIKKEKLYAGILNTPNQNITPQNAKRFYENNPSLFLQFDKVSLIRYLSNDANALNLQAKDYKSNIKGVQKESMTLSSFEIAPGLVYIFNNTPNGQFTPILEGPASLERFYIIAKNGSVLPPFEAVEQAVVNAMVEQEREIAIMDYFNKLKVKANIKYIK